MGEFDPAYRTLLAGALTATECVGYVRGLRDGATVNCGDPAALYAARVRFFAAEDACVPPSSPVAFSS